MEIFNNRKAGKFLLLTPFLKAFIMKKKSLAVLALAVSTLMLHSCSYGTYTKETFTPLMDSAPVCEKLPETVALYFEGEKTDFDYIKIGLIQVEGAKDTPQEKLLAEFKALAKRNCANTIIHIKKLYKTRTQGWILSDDKPEEYEAEVFHGIAVSKG
ncbi:MAG: hypothetical protein BGO42_08375 [Flavobacterium sp. 40-81]|nr:MAG: hypothetical protein BGO42_08375 [Flavobacterium sp. 40-81]